MHTNPTTYAPHAQPFHNTVPTTPTPRTCNNAHPNRVSKRYTPRRQRRTSTATNLSASDSHRTSPSTTSRPTPQFQASTPSNHTQNPAQPHVPIGTVLSNGDASQDRYQCHYSTCSHISFGRTAELRRHNKCQHSSGESRPQFWCPEDGCERSRVGEAFTRKDKMRDHYARIHGGGGRT